MKNPLFVATGQFSYAKKTDEEKKAFHSAGGKAGGKKRGELVKKHGYFYWLKKDKEQ